MHRRGVALVTSAGHGAGIPTSKAIQEMADGYAFLVKTLDIDVPPELAG
jgi:prolyl oligopeptidase